MPLNRSAGSAGGVPVRIHNEGGKHRVLVTKDLPGTRWLDILTAANCRVEARAGRDAARARWRHARPPYALTHGLPRAQVWEKAGVNVSVVYGSMPPDAYRAATGDSSKARAKAPLCCSALR
jgi:hypothetical protein